MTVYCLASISELFVIEPLTSYQVIGILGIPSIFAGFVGWLIAELKEKKLRRTMEKAEESEEIQALKMGVQALLRANMISEYNKWHEKGYMPIDVKDSFENVWKNYHAMGKNGVMDDIHEKAMDLPTSRPKSKD